MYLEPDTFKFRTAPVADIKIKKENVDAELYPEYYRKTSDSMKGLGTETPHPFCIGLIQEIKENSEKELLIKVRKFYRPENTHKGMLLWYQQDLNVLYWSDEGINFSIFTTMLISIVTEVTIPFSKVTGKCYLAFGDALFESPDEWSKKGPHRFYFLQAYDSKKSEFSDVPLQATKIGHLGKGKGELTVVCITIFISPV